MSKHNYDGKADLPDDHWIHAAIKHPGALHAETGTPAGQKIPAKKMKAAENSKNPKERERARFAEELEGFHKK